MFVFFRQNLLARQRKGVFMLDGIYTEAADASVFGKIERDKRLYDLKSLFGLGFKGFYKKTPVCAYPFFP